MTAVVVVILNVLGHQLQAVGAAGHPSGVVRVHGGHGVVAAQGPVPGAVVDYGIVSVDTS